MTQGDGVSLVSPYVIFHCHNSNRNANFPTDEVYQVL